MAITIGQAMRDIYGDNIRATNNTANTTNKSTLPVKQSTVSQPKTSTKTTGTITLASAFNDIYGDDTAYDTYVSNKTMYQPAVTDDENLQKKKGFWNNLFQTSKYYEDGYDSGDFLRTAGDTGKSALSSIAEGFLNTVEGVADFGQYAVSDVLDFFGATNAAENVRENAKFNSTASIFGKNTTGGDLFETGWKENLDKGSVLGSSGRQVFEGIGNIGALAGTAYLGSSIVGAAAPNLAVPFKVANPELLGTSLGESSWAAIIGSSIGSYDSAYGSSVSNALNEGYSLKDARKAGVISGFAEAISEQFFDGMTGLHTAGLGETIFGKLVPKTVTESMNEFFKTKAGKIISIAIDALEEGSEEVISNILTATGNDIAHLIDPTYSANGMEDQTGNWWQDFRAQLTSEESWNAFFSAMFTSAFLGGANMMVGDKPLLNSQQRQELIEAYAEDNNMTVEEAKGRLDLQESVQGQNDQTIERTVYSNVDTYMAIEEINKIDNLKDIEDLISQLQEDLTQDRDTRTMTREDLAPIAEKLNAARKHQQDLIKQMNAVEKADTLNNSLDEISNIVEETSNTMNDITNTPQASPEVLVAKDELANDVAKSIDEDTTIPVAENKKDVSVNYNQVEEAAIEYINQLNAEREAQGQPRITIIQNLTQEQTRIADALMALGRHVLFAKDLPGSFVTPTGVDNAQLNQVLYISDKINTGLLAKSNLTNKNQAMVYAVGHEMFHSLKMSEPSVYNSFVDYVANTITNDQILRFMEMYDPQQTQGLLEALQINGRFNLEEVLANPKQYASQYQALLNIAEEMTANEFGGMFTDTEYMTNLANQNKSLFKKLVNAIKKIFKDLDRPVYNSALTQLQISTIRQNFEDIITGVNNSLNTTTGLMNEINATNKNVANSQETVYNTPQKEEGYNEFERLQRESEELSDEEKQLYRSGSREIDEDLRRRLSTVFERRLESSRGSNSDEARVLTDPQSGNTFEVYENVDAQTFHDIFDIIQKYTAYGELVDVHPAISTEDETGYDSTRNYMTKDGLSGFAITQDGDLISVFNANDKRGWLRAISDIVKSEAKTLDCYASPNQDLQRIYKRIFGFQTASIMDYNMKYDHDNIAKNHNKPKVAFMVNTDQDVQTRSFNKDQYDEAKAYQMSFFDENASEKTSFADVATAYNDANSGKISVEEARAVYDKYLADGGSQDVDIETALNGLKNSVKKPKPTRQKLEKVTQQVNTSEQQTKSTRQKLPTKETVDQKITREFNRELKTNDAYLAFEEVIKNNNLSESQIDSLRQTAIDSTDSAEIQDSIRNWTPEIMAQEDAEIQELNQKAKSIEDEEKKKEKTPIKRVEQVQEIKLPKTTPIVNEEVKTTAINNDTWFKNIERIFDNYKNSTGDKQRAMLKSVVNAYTNYKEKGGTNIIQELEDIMASPEYKTQREAENAKKQDLFKDMMLSRGTINDNGTIRFLPNVENRSQEVNQVRQEARARNKKVSEIFANTFAKSPLSKDIFNVLRTNSTFTDYDYLSDEQSLQNARDTLAEKGEKAVLDFFSKTGLDKNDNALAEILLSYYSLTNDVDAQVAIWEKIRPEGTRAAQFLQSFNMLKKLSPEAMVQSIQTDLDRIAREMRESKDATLQAWIAEKFNSDKMKLTDAEKTWIREMWEKAKNMKLDSIEYKKTMAQIYAYIANKAPKSFTKKLKEYRRVAMLGNIKTMGRNILSNVFALPVNITADFFGAQLDKRLAQQTGMRTQGTFKGKSYWEGRTEGKLEAKEDYRLGINTQNINAYDRQTGRIFNDDKLAGRILNKASDLVNYFLDLGDRPFEKGYERNALANIMALNKHETATALDKQLASEEAETKVWKNKGKMADLAINTRQTLNKVHIGDFGLGDLILPFVLTPANLAAATYHYSPAAVLSVAKNFRDFNKTLQSSTATHADKVLAQKKAVDSFGKMAAGTILYAIAFAIAKGGRLTGEEDDDKDVAALMSSMGWKKYSVKIGDKYISYDWAQPFANPFAIMAEINQQRENGKFTGDSELENALQAIAQSFKLAGSRIQDQSFLASLQSIFSGKESIATGLIDFAADVPASFVPTASKQLADIIDGRVKTTYDKNNILSTAINKLVARIPGAKSLLPTKRTTLGADLRYQKGDNVLGNILWSAVLPANSSTDLAGEIGSEFFDVYSHTGDKTIMPQIAVNYVTYDSNGDGKTEKYQFSPRQQSDLQKAMGDIVTNGMQELLFNDVYNTASYTDKATALTSLVQYAKGKALEQSGYVPNYQIKSGNASQINKYVNSGLSIGEAVMYDSLINPIKGEKDANGDTIAGSQNGAKAYTIMNMAIPDKSKDVMLQLISPTSTTPETVNSLGNFNTKEEFQSYYSLARHDAFVNNKFSRDDIDLATKYFKFDVGNFTQYANELSDIKSDKDAKGNTISNSKKRKVTEYLNSLPLNPIQKTYLYSLAGYSIKPYRNELYNYINGLNVSAEEKQQLWKNLGF